MILYLIPCPPNKLARKNRESGWRHVPFDRQARKEMENIVEPLRGLGITVIHCSDLETKFAEIVRDKLNVPNVRPDFFLRRFNVGRQHASPCSDVDRIFGELIEKWKKNRDIPMRGGDSLTSFEKRFFKAYQKLTETAGVAALLVDQRTLSVIRDFSLSKYSAASLAPNGNAPAMTKIYKVENVIRTKANMESAASV